MKIRNLTEEHNIQDNVENIDTGVSSLLMSLIGREYDLLQEYESAQVTFEDHSVEDFNDIFDYIMEDINIHIGMLQAAVENVSPSAEKVDDGKEQGELLISDTTEIDDLVGE